MQTDRNDMKVEKSISMHSLAFERPCKRQIVADKLCNASHVCMYGNRKGVSSISNKRLIINLNNYLKTDLANALNYMGVSLGSIKKKHLKQIADHKNDFHNDQNSQDFYDQ